MYKKFWIITLTGLFYFSGVSNAIASDKTVIDSIQTKQDSIGNIKSDQRYINRYPPYFDSQTNKFVLRNEKAKFGRKFLRGAGLIVSMQTLSYGLLFAVPESVSSWDRSVLEHYGQNIKEAFTKPPVVDGDHWYINYLGHPFQGSYYYNAYRSQGAPFWQCALLSVAHSASWEYLIESGIERPSVQDLIVTPVVGSFMGEFFHFATMRMARNGFKWYEAATVCIINPMFALNNGFKFAKKKNEF
jgi:hypothetical protein